MFRINLFLLYLVVLASVLLFPVYAQQRQAEGVIGRVIDESGRPLAFVNVRINNINVATADNDGRFVITRSRINLPATVYFSLVGFKSETITVSSFGNLPPIILREDNVINEVVVIGYGESERKKLTSSVSKIEGNVLSQQPIESPVLGLQGRVPGLYITASSGNLGANPSVVLRGDNSILSSSDPLYIIDGVMMPSSGINSSSIGGPTGSMSPFVNLNSSDIQSIEVLKDADATAIYGTRGANGVILITTKQGKSGPTKVNIDIYHGFQQAVNKLDLISTEEYLQLRRDAFAADGIEPTVETAPDLMLWDQNQETDFQDLLFGKSAPLTNMYASIQGGNEKTTFVFGLGYNDENGVLIGKNNLKKGTFRISLDHRAFNDKLHMNGAIGYTLMNLNSIATDGAGAYTATLPPNLPLTDEATGLPYYFKNETWASSPLRNLHTGVKTKNYQLIASTTVGYDITKELNLKLDAAYTRLDYNGNQYYKNAYLNTYANYAYYNYSYFGTNYQYTYNLEPQLNYRADFGRLKWNMLAGATWQESIRGGQLVQGRDFSNENLISNLGSASTISSYSTTYTQYKFNSVFGRSTLDLDSKYFLNLTYRRDGSSRFAPDNRFGNFWAVGAAWNLSSEPFVRDHIPAISFAKLRTSYGLTGSDAISDYEYLETFESTDYTYNNESGMYANRLGNTKFKWESTYQFEAALELNLFNNRLNTVTAFFNKQGSNQLVRYPLASQTGWTYYVANLDGALIRNRGLEFELTSHNIKKDNFNWHTTFNITTYKNTLVSFPGLSSSTYYNTYEIGKSINLLRKYLLDYIDQQTGIPHAKDLDGDGLITQVGDYTGIGSSDPSFYGGLGNNFSYKGLELDVLFQFTRKPYSNGLLYHYYQPIGNPYNVPRVLYEGVWRSPEDPGTMPRLTTTTGGEVYAAYREEYVRSSVILEDASFIRLKNLMLSYTLPSKYTSKLGMTNLRVYALGQNLFTWTGYEGFDPETGASALPVLKTYTLGVNLTF